MEEAGGRRGHEPSLDGLRGLASLLVVIRHSFNAMVIPAAWRLGLAQSPFAVLLNGQGAVQIFFVLSGWVLAGSLERSAERPPWPQFFVRRVLRIHPPYVVAMLLGLIPSALPVVREAVTPWTPPLPLPDPAALAGHLAFPGDAGGLFPVGWTLQVEMIHSLLFPLLLIAASVARGVPLLLGCLVLAFATDTTALRYAFDFALGIAAYRERRPLAVLLGRLPVGARGVLIFLGLLLWTFPLLFWPRIARDTLIAGFSAREIALMGVGAVILVVCAVYVPSVQRVLSRRPCLFLGRISYSLYLLHATAISLFAPRLIDGSLRGNLASLVAVAVVSIALSVPFHRFVERPAIALGNRCCRALARRIGTSALESHAAQVP